MYKYEIPVQNKVRLDLHSYKEKTIFFFLLAWLLAFNGAGDPLGCHYLDCSFVSRV